MKEFLAHVVMGMTVAAVFGLVLFLIMAGITIVLTDNTPIETPEVTVIPAPQDPEALPPTGPGSAVAIDDPEPQPAPPPAAAPQVAIKLVSVIYLDVTAYTRYSDNKPGYVRRYANDDLTDLPLAERRLSEEHYTVALNAAMDAYHRAVVRLPDGQYTHRYRLHLKGYNTDTNFYSEHYRGDLSWLNGSYFSVPRDRMPAQWHGRADVLFTGDREHCQQEARIWGKRFMPVEIYEIEVLQNSTGIPLTSAETSVK